MGKRLIRATGGFTPPTLDRSQRSLSPNVVGLVKIDIQSLRIESIQSLRHTIFPSSLNLYLVMIPSNFDQSEVALDLSGLVLDRRNKVSGLLMESIPISWS